MKKLFIVGNWKSNKTESEASDWLQGFKIQDLGFKNKEIIICPPFTLLSILKTSIKLGAQDISPFDEGAYTGEINGKQIKEFADYVIIGHSERRKNFGEDESIIEKKIEQADKYGLIPIICVSDINQAKKLKTLNSQLSTLNFLVAYEPIFAIGSGTTDTPENAETMAKKIKEIINVPVLYGGSVNAENVKSFTTMEDINGVLVGGASLDPQVFASLIINA